MYLLKKIGKNILRFTFVLLVGIILVNAYSYFSTLNCRYSQVDNMPQTDVALVLGTSSTPDGRYYNTYFYERIKTAAELYSKSKVKHFILSGDNHVEGYNEPNDMKKLLVEMGVPSENITLDYAGFRTLDSVVRSKKVFGQDKLCIVSQAFHNPRALLIAESYGIEAISIDASTNVVWKRHIFVLGREVLATCKAFLDLFIINAQPKYLGEQIKIEIK